MAKLQRPSPDAIAAEHVVYLEARIKDLQSQIETLTAKFDMIHGRYSDEYDRAEAAEAKLAQLAAEGRSEGRATWQPIDVYLHEFDRHFTNDSPLAAREYFADTIRFLLNRSTWQPISSAPKDKTWFLGWNSDCGVFVSRDGPGLLTGEDPAPTHWMPLPEGPKE